MPAPAAGTTVRIPGGRIVPSNDVPIGIDPNSQPGIDSNLHGTMPGGYDPAYGGVPIIPDPTASAWQAIGGDLSSLPQLFTLGNAYNLFNFGQQQQELGSTPGYSNVTDLMHGKLPQDVINEIAQGAAERGVAGGQPMTDSPNSNAAYLSALGLDSLKAQQMGQQEYGNLAGLYPMGAPFNVNEFLTTPEQQQAANAAANTAAAAPNPAAAAAAEQKALLDAIAAGKGSVPGVGPTPGIGPSISGSLTNPPPAAGGGGGVPASGSYPIQSSSRVPGRPPDAITGSAPTGPSGNIVDQITAAMQGLGPGQGTPWPGGGVIPSGPGGGADWWKGSDPSASLSTIDWAAPTNIPSDAPGSDWWNQSDPWSSLSNMDWGAPSDAGGTDTSTLPPPTQQDWWNAPDPWAALTGQDWTQPPPQTDYSTGYNSSGVPDWASAPSEDYYGP